jgi:hypothetical protein
MLRTVCLLLFDLFDPPDSRGDRARTCDLCLPAAEVAQKNQFPESATVSGQARVSLRRCVILDILLEMRARWDMSNTAQKRAVKNFRSRLKKKGLARFEVLGLDTDRSLIRSLAKRLAQDDPEATQIRLEVTRTVSDMPRKGGILAALRRSPLVGADIRIERPFDSGRKVDL